MRRTGGKIRDTKDAPTLDTEVPGSASRLLDVERTQLIGGSPAVPTPQVEDSAWAPTRLPQAKSLLPHSDASRMRPSGPKWHSDATRSCSSGREWSSELEMIHLGQGSLIHHYR